MKDVQCYELFGGIALQNHAFSCHSSKFISSILNLNSIQIYVHAHIFLHIEIHMY